MAKIEDEIIDRQRQMKVLDAKIKQLVAEKEAHQHWISESCPHPKKFRYESVDITDLIIRQCMLCNMQYDFVGHVEEDERWVYDD